jgi:hypothetical protein
VESYNGQLRRELLDLELLDSVLEAQVLIDDSRVHARGVRTAVRSWREARTRSEPAGLLGAARIITGIAE